MIDTYFDDADEPETTIDLINSNKSQDEVTLPEVNLAEGPGTSSYTVLIRSRSQVTL